MTDTSLLLICAAALVAVFLVLGLLAGMIRILTLLFPEPQQGLDPAVLAAISAAAATAYPGTQVTRVEETR